MKKQIKKKAPVKKATVAKKTIVIKKAIHVKTPENKTYKCKCKKTWWVIGAVVLIAIIVLLVLLLAKPETCTDTSCLADSFKNCSPADLEMTSAGITIDIKIEAATLISKCNYSMMVGEHGVNCTFNKEDMDDSLYETLMGSNNDNQLLILQSCTIK